MWHHEFSIETTAAPERIWGLFKDVAGWPKWNAGIDRIEIHGPFAVGTTFVMKPPEGEPISSQLVEVRKNEVFVDETRLGSLVVRVSHRIEPIDAELTRIVYAIVAEGPDAEASGRAISADFPDVLKALALFAEIDHREQLLKYIYAAFNARDIGGALSAMAPDVIWPNGAEGGSVIGHEGIRAYWTKQWNGINPMVHPKRFTALGHGEILVEAHQVVKDPKGRVLNDQIVHHVYAFEDGLVKSMEIRPVRVTN